MNSKILLSLVQQASSRPNEIFLPFYNWQPEAMRNQISNNNPASLNYTSDFESAIEIFVSKLAVTQTTTLNPNSISNSMVSSTDVYSEAVNGLNCTNVDYIFNERSKFSTLIEVINFFTHVTIFIGILFNILNLIVLLKSKLNESPYTYLTMLAFSDLGAIFMVGIEKIRQSHMESDRNDPTGYSHLYVAAGINIFLSTSMYITLALTIERFIFVHSPFKAMTICRRSIARRVCVVIFIFSFLRSLYLPLMYTRNCYKGFDQKKNRVLDVYEFLISLAIPYLIILIANISLIRSLKKQNNLMSVSYSLSNNLSLLSRGRSNSNGVVNGTQQQQSAQASTTTGLKKKLKPKFRRFSSPRNDAPAQQDPNPVLLELSDKINSTKKSTQSLHHTQEEATPLTPNVKSTPGIMRHSNTMSSIFTFTTSCSSQSKPKMKTSNSTNTIATNAPPNRRFNSNNNNNNNSSNNTTSALVTSTSSSIYSNLKLSTLYRKTSNLREIRNQKKLTTTLITILCLLLVCYLPSFVFEESLANAIFGTHEQPYLPETPLIFIIKSLGYRISILLIYINCSANFLIYCFCNKKFKNSLKLLIKKSCFNSVCQRLSYYSSKYCCPRFNKKSNLNNVNHIELFHACNTNTTNTLLSSNSNKQHLAYCTHFRKNSSQTKLNNNQMPIESGAANNNAKEVTFRTDSNQNSIQTSSFKHSELNFKM